MSKGFDFTGNFFRCISQSNMEVDKAIDETQKIADGIYPEDMESPTIFNIDEASHITFEDFCDGFRSHSEFDDVDEEDLKFLYNLLNQDGNGDLSYDELNAVSENGNGKEVTGLSMWYKIAYCADKDEIAEYSDNHEYMDVHEKFDIDPKYKDAYDDIYGAGESDKVTEGQVVVELQDLSNEKIENIATKILNGEMSLAHYHDFLTEDAFQLLSETLKMMKNNDTTSSQQTGGTEGTTGTTGTEGTGETEGTTGTEETGGTEGTTGTEGTGETEGTTGTTDNENDQVKPEEKHYDHATIELLKTKGNSPKEVADALLKEGTITQAQYDEIKASYEHYTDQELAQIEFYMDQGKTKEEAIKLIGHTSNSTFDVPFPPEPKTDAQLKVFSDQLKDSMHRLGTDDEQFHSIINSKLSGSDLVGIMKTYMTDGDSFINDVDGDFSGDTKDQIMDLITTKLIEEAKNGNAEALDIICKELYNGTAGQNGTADEFVAGIIGKADDELLAQIATRYSEVNEGHNLTKDIKKDFSGQIEDDYIKRINDALLDN